MMAHISWTRSILISAILATVAALPCRAQGSEYYFPQVADGVTGNISYISSFLITNPQSRSNQITARFFLPSSLTWLIDLRCEDRPELAGRVTTRTFSLNAGESVRLSTGGTDPFSAGWAKIESSLPLSVSEVFDVVGGEATLPVGSEAGVLPASVDTEFSLFISESSDEPVSGTNVDTGFALVNPSGGVARVTGTLYSRLGTFLGQSFFTLLPGTQTAQFVSQLFSNVNLADVARHGRVRFSSNVNLAFTALRQTYGNSSTISTIAVNPDSSFSYGILHDREPNDTRASAQSVGNLPVMLIGTINSTGDGQDVDTFSLRLKGSTVLFLVSLTDMIGSTLEDSVQIQDTNGNPVLMNIIPAGLNGSIVNFPVSTDGTYYLLYTSRNNSYGRGSYYRLLLMAR
jgi:hypothetical protein